jgi:AraC-like DNA-binding protein
LGQNRNWTNTEGKSISGMFLAQDAEKVKLRLATGKEAIIPKSSLSAADKEFLLTQPNEGLDANSLQKSRQTAFDEAKVDVAKFELTEGYIALGSPEFTRVLTTPHYKIISTPKFQEAQLRAFGESAERLWHHLSENWPALAAIGSARRMLIFLSRTPEEDLAIGAWMAGNSALGVPYAWSKPTFECAMLKTPDPAAMGLVNCFRRISLHDKEMHGNTLKWPARIHFLAATWYHEFLVGIPYTPGDESICGLVAGMAYEAEREICGKVSTFLKEPDGFKSGYWVDPVKRLSGKSSLPTDLQTVLKRTTNDMSSADMAIAWSLIRFLNDDAGRWKNFRAYLEELHKTKNKPTATALVKSCGYSSLEAFNEAWRSYLGSQRFD